MKFSRRRCRADLAPLRHLPRLQALHVEAEALPTLGLAQLPRTLRHLSLSSFANAARVSLPRGLLLDSLAVICPGQPVFLGLGRALAQCRCVRVTGCRLRLLLQVRPGWVFYWLSPAQRSAPRHAPASVRHHLSAVLLAPNPQQHDSTRYAGAPRSARRCSASPRCISSRQSPLLGLFTAGAGSAAHS